MDAIYTYKGAVVSQMEKIKPFVEEVIGGVKNYIYDDETIFDLKLILDELVVNGALHGNELNEDKYVFLNLTLKDSSVIINVIDEGDGVEYTSDLVCFDTQQCTGRGLILVEALTDKLIFNNNEVTALKLL